MSTLTHAETSPSASAPVPESTAPALPVPVQRAEPASTPGQEPAHVTIPRQVGHRNEAVSDPLLRQATSAPIPRYRNGVGLAAYGTAFAALALSWSPLTRDLAVILALTGLVLAGLAVLHAYVGIANNAALAAVAGLTCLAALALPGVLRTAVVEPAGPGERDTSTAGIDYSTCLAQSYSTEQANACH